MSLGQHDAGAYLFDLDGTIVDNMSHHLASWVEVLSRHGVQADPQEFFARTSGRHGREVIRMYLGEHLADAECDQIAFEKDSVYRRLFSPHLAPVAGFERFIAQAQQRGIALAVGSAGPPRNISFVLDGLRLRDSFRTVVGAADVPRGKPAPDVFLLAAERCGIAPQRCIVFEDAPLGVEAARNAGMQAVVLTTTLPREAFAAYDNILAFAGTYEELLAA